MTTLRNSEQAIQSITLSSLIKALMAHLEVKTQLANFLAKIREFCLLSFLITDKELVVLPQMELVKNEVLTLI
jgi:hypothetical protein